MCDKSQAVSKGLDSRRSHVLADWSLKVFQDNFSWYVLKDLHGLEKNVSFYVFCTKEVCVLVVMV